MRFIDLTGKSIGRWTVIQRSTEKRRNKIQWICKCKCGITRVVMGSDLNSGHSQSCGCLKAEATGNRARTHGKSRNNKTYNAWCGMKDRCYNPKATHFNRYGGRGITVCDQWRNSFEQFLTDMREAPIGYSLDRINND